MIINQFLSEPLLHRTDRDFIAFELCPFCVVIRFLHPRHIGQRPPTSKEFFTRSYPLHYLLILILEKEPVFPFLMLSAKQWTFWYHFYTVFGMTRSPTHARTHVRWSVLFSYIYRHWQLCQQWKLTDAILYNQEQRTMRIWFDSAATQLQRLWHHYYGQQLLKWLTVLLWKNQPPCEQLPKKKCIYHWRRLCDCYFVLFCS